MCGIVGVLAQQVVSQAIFDALTIVQHRGQDAAGMLTSNDQRVTLRKDNGLVRDVIRQEHILRLTGPMGIGHVRYPTAGSDNPQESQPFYVNSPYGLGLVHNGNLINADSLTTDLVQTDLRHLNTPSDSEVLLNVVAHELQQVGGVQLTPEAVQQAFAGVYRRVQGAFSAILLIHGYGLVAFRDPHGIRPLVYGRRDQDYMIASESIALDALGFTKVDDVKPGEVIYFENSGRVHRFMVAPGVQHTPCLFEYIYLARPDSVLDNISVYQARVGLGNTLAEQIMALRPQHDIDVVIPVPDTSRISALALAQRLKCHFSEGIVKNRYIGRTFIMPGQEQRKASVRLKLNAIREEMKDKVVLLVDDSIVRGTTSREIIQMVREAGAKKVYFASAAPKVCYPNLYGIDIPSSQELIAHGKTTEEIAQWIGADWLVYQTLSDAVMAVNSGALFAEAKVSAFEDSIFSGHYRVGSIDEAFLTAWAQQRRKKKSKIPLGPEVLKTDDCLLCP